MNRVLQNKIKKPRCPISGTLPVGTYGFEDLSLDIYRSFNEDFSIGLNEFWISFNNEKDIYRFECSTAEEAVCELLERGEFYAI